MATETGIVETAARVVGFAGLTLYSNPVTVRARLSVATRPKTSPTKTVLSGGYSYRKATIGSTDVARRAGI
jgi:hypothetical protein